MASAITHANGRRRFERRRKEWLQVFDADPELLEGVEPNLAEYLLERVHVELVVLGAGSPLPPFSRADEASAGFGLLVLEGVLVRKVAVHDAAVLDLVLAGDSIYPWSLESEFPSLPSTATWWANQRTELAVLDRRFTEQVNAAPEVRRVLALRDQRRADRYALMRAVVRLPVRRRLLAVLWLLSDQVGVVTAAGRVLPLRLTHETLAEMIGASRPRVTDALGELNDERTVVKRRGGGWLLSGAPPARPEAGPV